MSPIRANAIGVGVRSLPPPQEASSRDRSRAGRRGFFMGFVGVVLECRKARGGRDKARMVRWGCDGFVSGAWCEGGMAGFVRARRFAGCDVRLLSRSPGSRAEPEAVICSR